MRRNEPVMAPHTSTHPLDTDVFDLIEGSLDAASAQLIEAHLEQCLLCRIKRQRLSDAPPIDFADVSGLMVPEYSRIDVQDAFGADANRGELWLTVGEEAAITGPVGLSDEGPYSEFVANYRPSRYGDWLGTAILSGRDGVGSARTTGGTVTTTARHGRCTASAARYGDRQATPIDLDWCWDEATALRCLEVAAQRAALPARMVDLDVAGGEDLLEGDEITLYDEDRGFDGVAAIVDGPPLVGSSLATVSFRVPT